VLTEAAGDHARDHKTRDELAKAWLVKIIERTPPEELGEVPLAWIATEAAPLIADILDQVAREVPALDELGDEDQRRARELGRLRRGEGARQIPRDIASLQALLIEALRREVPEHEDGDFPRAVERLAEIFGTIQATVVESLVEERSGWARRDETTGLPGVAQLHEWLRILVAEFRRYAHPFSVLLVDVDGLQRINQAYGREVGDRMLRAVGGAIERQVRNVDQAFRLSDDQFCILIPHQVSDRVMPLADRLASMVNAWQRPEGPRVTVTVGVVSCPEHGNDSERLLQAAEEATYAAKAAGRSFAVGAAQAQSFVQDPDTT
jgi:diguanylate cyclase (GGDEF)-like protein